ncbi:MAG TPA: chemotaxis protein CheC [Methylomirabilota bacterium]|nr:chemotaxis protein CheC [Methylomirabilota bacterium]
MNDNPTPSPAALDALCELVNIGVGRAAAALAELTGRTVAIAVPTVEVVRFDHPSQVADLQQGITLRVSQAFTGGLSGQALLILNSQGAQRLAELLLGKPPGDGSFDANDQAALLELGNIIIGGVIGRLVDHLGVSVNYDLPMLQLRGVSDVVDLISDLVGPGQTHLLLMRASLSIAAEHISGYLILLAGGPLEELFQKIESSLNPC